MKQILKLLEEHIQERMIDRHRGLEILLDFLIDMFDINHFKNNGFENHCIKLQSEEPYLFEIAILWMSKVADAMDKGDWLDLFGLLYEELYQTKNKASSLGQFYTPKGICDLMAKISYGEGGMITDNGGCGSGRTLLAYHSHSKYSNRNYYVGDDIDTISVKMCALNMMIHGMRGRVVRHNVLYDPVYFDYGFEINEVRYPIPTCFYSLRKIKYEQK